MVIGVARVELHLPDSRSLKNKRGILNSLKDRIRHSFNVSVAEVEFQDKWQRACLGIVAVSNDRRFSDQVLARTVSLVEAFPAAQLIDYSTELIDASL